MSEDDKESMFREEFKESLRALLENLDELTTYNPPGTTGVVRRPIPVDPSSMGISSADFESLTEEDKKAIASELFASLGIDPNLPGAAMVDSYETVAPQEATVPGRITVLVYGTNRADVYLQRLTFTDGEIRWMIGPKERI